jgi:HEAT repeat protein
MRTLILCCVTALAATPGLARAAPVAEDEGVLIARRLTAVVRDPALPTRARVAAAKALGQMGVPAAAPELSAILEDTHRNYPFALDEALIQAAGRLGAAGRDLVPSLVRNAGRDCDLDHAINESVAQILRGPRLPPAVAILIEQLRSSAGADRLRAAKELAQLGPQAREAVRALAEALEDEDPDVRRQALRALLIVRPGPMDRAMLGVLIRDLGDPNEGVRLAAVKGLIRAGLAARFALPALQAAARNDPDEDVRRLAGDAVGRLQGGGTGEPPPVP